MKQQPLHKRLLLCGVVLSVGAVLVVLIVSKFSFGSSAGQAPTSLAPPLSKDITSKQPQTLSKTAQIKQSNPKQQAKKKASSVAFSLSTSKPEQQEQAIQPPPPSLSAPQTSRLGQPPARAASAPTRRKSSQRLQPPHRVKPALEAHTPSSHSSPRRSLHHWAVNNNAPATTGERSYRAKVAGPHRLSLKHSNRVALLTLEPLPLAEDYLLPAHSVLYATSTLTAQAIELHIEQVTFASKQFKTQLAVYNINGHKGIPYHELGITAPALKARDDLQEELTDDITKDIQIPILGGLLKSTSALSKRKPSFVQLPDNFQLLLQPAKP